MNHFKVLRPVSMFPALAKYRYKKDIPAGCTPIRLSFGLWGDWYCAKSFHGLLKVDGTEMPVHTAYLNGVGWLIGPRDGEAAKGLAFEDAWRASYHEANMERLGLAPKADL